MTKRCAAILAGLLMVGVSGGSAEAAAAFTGCHLRIKTAKTSWIIQGYDPFGYAVPVDEFEATLINDGASACSVRSAVDLSAEPFGLDQGAAARIGYTLEDLSDSRDITPTTGMTLLNPTRPLLVVAGNSQVSVRFRLTVVDIAKLAGDGRFVQNATLEARDENGSTLASKQVILGLDVKPAALVGLSGSFRLNGGRALIDLGQLHEGIAPILLSLYVKSTRPYTIDLSSANEGNLKLGNTDWAIPYQMVIGDRTVPLSGNAQYVSPRGTSLARQSLPLGFAIGKTSDLRAGRYSDVITISIAPQ
jgi:hypothetical protein